MTDVDTELAEVQARKKELERQQDHLRERIKRLRAKEQNIRAREGRTQKESATGAIRRAMEALDPDEPHGYPRGDVLETAAQMAPHLDDDQIQGAYEGLKRRGEIYEPSDDMVKST